MSRPTTNYVRRQALLDWLVDREGFAAHEVKKWISTGTIAKHTFAGGTRAYYRVGQVVQALALDSTQPTKQT